MRAERGHILAIVRRSSAIRAIAWGVVAAGAAAPLVRKRVKAPSILTQTVAYAAPLGLCVAVRRSRARDVAACGLQMWAYVAAYKSPHDDPELQERHTHFAYPIVADRILGLGELPTVRLQRALARQGPNGPQWRALDRILVWAHWSWFLVPHGSVAYVLMCHPQRFPRAAVMTYAVFNLGASFYWVAPTAPPWYAAEVGAPGAEGTPAVRRMMVEYGELFWRDGWGPLYSVFGGNPLAAMPSLHFATSLMAALLLAEVGPVAGALGFSYAITLGFALVYLGEHYVVDLIAGAALTAAVRRLGPRAGPLLERISHAVAELESIAHEGGAATA
jgi:PAP2 superfamily